jgi:glycosyltransferase involved in cell wall biosynthesis
MVILHLITRLNQGGTAVWLGHLVREMTKSGHKVTLAAGEVSPGEIEDDLFIQEGGIRIVGLQREVNLRNDLRAFKEIRRLIQEIKPDVINTHTSKAGVVGRIAALSLARKRSVVIHTYHGHILYGYFGKFSSFFIAQVERLLSRFTDHFVVSGLQVLSDLQQKKIIKRNNYTIVRPGVNGLDQIPKDRARDLLGIPTEKFVIGWMGRFEPIKRPDRVVELARNNPKFTFLAAGDGTLLKEMKSFQINNLVLPGWSLAQVIWSAADIAISTSENEAQPIALVEAGLCEIPSVAFDVGSTSDVIQNDVNGFVVKTLDEMEMRLKELSLCRDHTRRLGQQAKKLAEANFSVGQFIDSHLQVYEGVLKKNL